MLRRAGGGGFLVVGGRIAVTHPRRPVILPVRQPAVSVCLAEDPIPLGPEGGAGVGTLLAVIGPDGPRHLAVPGRLSRSLAARRFRGLLDGLHSPEEIMDQVWLEDCGLAAEIAPPPIGLAE